MEALETQRKKDPFMKSLVVSQFTSFLDVLQKPIKAAGFSFVRLDGTISQRECFCWFSLVVRFRSFSFVENFSDNRGISIKRTPFVFRKNGLFKILVITMKFS